MKILVLGGDGYLGWPMSMHLSLKGHDVTAVDNFLRRRICIETQTEPLYPAPHLNDRAAIWSEQTGHTVKTAIGDLSDWSFVSSVFERVRPDAIIHLAEQPSAPYSMMTRDAATLTLHNNLGVTLNLIYAVREFCPECHIVKLGTMGEYGTPNIDIEEGWLEITHKGRKGKFLYPRQAGSLYHTTKIMDTDLLWFYARMWNIRITDLMQGPVYGIETEETAGNIGLYPAFNYDEIFGTVLNRFIVQAVCGYPLTVYGKGGQTRGFLNIRDTLNCIRLSIENPPSAGELRIFNQFTELFSVKELADKVAKVGGSMGLKVEVRPIANPRKEAEEHYYNVTHSHLLDLGLKPQFLTDDVVAGMIETVTLFKDKIDPKKFLRGIKW